MGAFGLYYSRSAKLIRWFRHSLWKGSYNNNKQNERLKLANRCGCETSFLYILSLFYLTCVDLGMEDPRFTLYMPKQWFIWAHKFSFQEGERRCFVSKWSREWKWQGAEKLNDREKKAFLYYFVCSAKVKFPKISLYVKETIQNNPTSTNFLDSAFLNDCTYKLQKLETIAIMVH